MDKIETSIGTFTKTTPFKIFIALAIVALLVLPYGVKAETGTIILSNQSSLAYSTGICAASPAAQNPTFTTFYFYNTGYSTLSWFNYTGAPISFSQQSDWTTFHITSGGSGDGIFSYSQYLSQLKWVFSPNTTITSSSFTITYGNSSILNEFSITAQQSSTFPSLANPVFIASNSGGGGCIGAGTEAGTYFANAIGSTSTTNYTLTYPTPGYFSMNVTKLGNVATKDFIHSTSNNSLSYFAESSFNTNSFQTFLQQTDGIYLKVTLQTGEVSDVLINASGVPFTGQNVPSGGQVNPAPTIPTSGGTIQFNQTQYNRGDQGLVQWAISNTEFDCIILCNSFYYVRFNPQGTIVENVPINIQTGNNPFIAQKSDIGAIKVELWEYNYLTNGYPGSKISTGTSNVIENPTIILTSGNVNAQQNFTIQVKYGYSANLTPSNFFIKTERLDNISGFLRENIFNADTVVTAGNIYSYSIYVNEAGQYRISIIDPTTGTIATTIITSTASIIIPPNLNVTKSSLTSDSPSYFLGQTIQLNYIYDSLNFSGNGNTALGLSNQGFGKFIRIINTDNQMIINDGITLYAQQGSLSVPINNFDPITCSSQCDPQASIWFSGNISIQLNVYNLTTRATAAVAYANITLNSVNVGGYGIQPLTGSNLCLGDDYKFKIIVPGFINQSHIIITYLDNSSQPQQIQQRFTNFTQSFTLHPIQTGEYEITLYDANNNIQATQIVFFKTCAFPTPTPTPTGTSFPGQNGTWKPTQTDIGKTCSFWDGWVNNFFGTQGINDVTRFEFSLMWIAAFMIIAFMITKNLGSSVVLGFPPYAFFLFLSLSTPCGSYIPTWTAILLALIVTVKLRWF